MITDLTDCARHMANGVPHTLTAPRAAAFCWQSSLRRTVFAVTLLVLAGMLPAVVHSAPVFHCSSEFIDARLDRDHNGLEDLLDDWLAGGTSYAALRLEAAPPSEEKTPASNNFPYGIEPAQTSWKEGLIRILCLGSDSQSTTEAATLASSQGICRVLHDLDVFGGVQVLSLDELALKTFLQNKPDGRILLDRNGTPALDNSVRQMGGRQAAGGHWQLGDDWSGTVAILDSGCDSAHDDLGDFSSDNIDGPAPEVGDSSDWYPGNIEWPVFSGYRIVGWHDVTDDFPEAQGPWDYHHHGTALASVVAGSGRISEQYKGVAPGSRLTVVKFYDFDQVWHTWAGDFLAACAWTLEHRDEYRIRVVLSAVNWVEDLGISDAMNEMVAVGLIPVAAMGNYGESDLGPGFPASVPDVLTVGSVNDEGAVSAFSGRGLEGWGKPDLMAPGGGLLASHGRIIAADNDPNDTYSGRSGTSLAAAHTAGAAYILSEAMAENAIYLPRDATAVRTVRDLLRGTSGRISQMENSTGDDLVNLPPHEAPDELRGWGTLRVDAAVSAALHPLFPGEDQTDTLTADDYRTVIARRIFLSPGVRYLLEAVPQADLDVDMALIDPRLVDYDPYATRISRQNAAGPGVSEFVFHEAGACDWAFLVVRRVSGQGEVTLRVREADSFLQQGRLIELPGLVSAAPNYGTIENSPGTTTVIPSRVSLDPSAHAVNLYNGWGLPIPGWPVFVFPQSSAAGGLSQPLVWNLDGEDGDEIVLASDFGSIYFFNHLGAYDEIELAFNRYLTSPVGMITDGGMRQVAVVDGQGVLRMHSWGPTLQATRDFEHNDPLQPAVGILQEGQPERLVVAFKDGTLSVVDALGNDLPNWPQDLGVELLLPPVLADVDDDGHREILLPIFDEDAGSLRVRIFEADGTTAVGDDTLLPTGEGGSWLRMSWPLMAGRSSTGDLRLEMVGLFDNAMTGVDARWGMARTGWNSANLPFASTLSGFQVAATTSQGFLRLDKTLMATPLAWDFKGGPGSEVVLLAGFAWQEILYGLTSIPGSTMGWFVSDPTGRPLEGRQPLARGGGSDALGTSVASVLVPIEDDLHFQVQIFDSTVHMVPMRVSHDISTFWPSARADQRNTAAYPIGENLTPIADVSHISSTLSVYPNPGSGQFQFSWQGGGPEGETSLHIYDLRGHLVARLRSSIADGSLSWDGRDGLGRAAAAGTYLAVARRHDQRSVARIVLTR